MVELPDHLDRALAFEAHITGLAEIGGGKSKTVLRLVRMNLEVVRAVWEVVLDGINEAFLRIQPDSFGHDECGEDEDRLVRVG